MQTRIYPNEAWYFRESEEIGSWGVQPIVEG